VTRPTRPPARLLAAVDSLDVQPDDQILEIGCGRGVAAHLICQRLESGRLLAIDRSATAISAATARNAEAVVAGQAEFLNIALEDLDNAGVGRYDKALAVNVSLFWIRPAHRELRLIADLLKPGGQLLLWYEAPDARRLAQVQDRLVGRLEPAGYRCTPSTHTAGRSTLLAVTARPTTT
jgi:SAM-dependent methyltransferase